MNRPLKEERQLGLDGYNVKKFIDVKFSDGHSSPYQVNGYLGVLFREKRREWSRKELDFILNFF